METVYIVKEVYDVDGGFGDAVEKEMIIGATMDKKLAEDYVEKYDKPEVYATPYADLYHHHLIIEKLTLGTLDLSVDPWADDEE